MMAARFGEVNSPMPIPFSSKMSANCQHVKLTGRTCISQKEPAATTMPPVANGHAPK